MPTESDPTIVLRQRVAALIASAVGGDGDAIESELIPSANLDSDFTTNSGVLNSLESTHLPADLSRHVHIEHVTPTVTALSVNYADSIGESAIAHVKQLGEHYGLVTCSTADLLRILVVAGQNQLTDLAILLEQLALADSIKSLYSVTSKARVQIASCLSDCPSSGFEVAIPVDNSSAIVNDSIAVFRPQTELQYLRYDLQAHWLKSQRILRANRGGEDEIVFDTNQYTYGHVLRVTYQAVGSTCGKVVNDRAYVMTEQRDPVPVVTYGSHVYPLGNALSLIDALKDRRIPQVLVVPGSTEWLLAQEVRQNKGDAVFLVMAPHLPVTTFITNTSDTQPTFSSMTLGNSYAHFGVLLASGREDSRNWYSRGKAALDLIGEVFQRASTRHRSKPDLADNSLALASEEQRLIRLIMRFPTTMIAATDAMNAPLLAQYAMQVAETYKHIEHLLSGLGTLDKLTSVVLRNAMTAIGFEVATT